MTVYPFFYKTGPQYIGEYINTSRFSFDDTTSHRRLFQHTHTDNVQFVVNLCQRPATDLGKRSCVIRTKTLEIDCVSQPTIFHQEHSLVGRADQVHTETESSSPIVTIKPATIVPLLLDRHGNRRPIKQAWLPHLGPLRNTKKKPTFFTGSIFVFIDSLFSFSRCAVTVIPLHASLVITTSCLELLRGNKKSF
jgi:hypothetical protein